MPRARLDHVLVERGFFHTRSRARDAVIRGAVSVGGMLADKPGHKVLSDCVIEVRDPARQYVSRAALKLVHALDCFALSPDGLCVLDIGASTGGFTQVLLERGARGVIAVDVGHGQLATSLRADTRVCALEGLNARALEARHLPERPGAVVCDVSFISLKLALAPALALALPGAWLSALIKPQFEAGRGHIDKAGRVTSAHAIAAVCQDIHDWLAHQPGWRVLGIAPSPLTGACGNREHLIAARKA